MRLGRPLAAASTVTAMTGISLTVSPVFANSSNSNSSSTPSNTAEATTPPSKLIQPNPTPSKTGKATSAPGKVVTGSSFKIIQEKTFAPFSTNTPFTISGTGCVGEQAIVGIALYVSDGSISGVVKTEAVVDGSWTSGLDLVTLVESIGTTTVTITDGRTIDADCIIYDDKTKMTQATKQQQTQIYLDDTRISGPYEIPTRTESQSQIFTFRAQDFYASEKVAVLLRSKSDSSASYTLNELMADANGNLTGSLSAPTNTPDGEYVPVLTDPHRNETTTNQTVTTISQHTFTIVSSECSTTETGTSEQRATESSGGDDRTSEQKTTDGDGDRTSEQRATENNGGDDKTVEQKTTENNGGGDKSTEQRVTENNGGGDKTSEQKTAEDNGGDDKASEQKTTEHSTSERQNSEWNTTERSTPERQSTEQKTSEQNTTECSTSENNGGDNEQAGGDKTTKQKVSKKETAKSNGGGNNGGSNSNANAGGDKQAGVGENKAGADKGNNLSSNAEDFSSENRAGGETTKDSGSSLVRTGTNGLLFDRIATFLVVAGGVALVLRRRNGA